MCLKNGDLGHAEKAYTSAGYQKGLKKIGDVYSNKGSLEESVRCYELAKKIK